MCLVVNLTTNSHTRHAAFAIGMVTNSRIYTTHYTTSHAPLRTRHAAFAIRIASDGVDEEAFNEIKEKEEEEEADGVVQLLSVGFFFKFLQSLLCLLLSSFSNESKDNEEEEEEADGVTITVIIIILIIIAKVKSNPPPPQKGGELRGSEMSDVFQHFNRLNLSFPPLLFQVLAAPSGVQTNAPPPRTVGFTSRGLSSCR